MLMAVGGLNRRWNSRVREVSNGFVCFGNPTGASVFNVFEVQHVFLYLVAFHIRLVPLLLSSIPQPISGDCVIHKPYDSMRRLGRARLRELELSVAIVGNSLIPGQTWMRSKVQ